MLARVTTFEGGTPEGIRAATEEVRSNADQGAPPGVNSTGFTMLVNPEAGRVMFVGLFAGQSELRESEAAANEMNPPEGFGTRSSTEIFEVGAETRL